MPGNEFSFFSVNKILNEDAHEDFSMEYIKSLTPSGMPKHVLKLKLNSVVICLKNLAPKRGVCNGTRMRVKDGRFS